MNSTSFLPLIDSSNGRLKLKFVESTVFEIIKRVKVLNVALKCKALLLRVLCSSLMVSTKQNETTCLGTSLAVLWENFSSCGVLRSNIKQHAWEAPSYYQSVASAAMDIKDVFITFVGKSLMVKVIYAKLLIVSRVRVRSKTLWQEKLGRVKNLPSFVQGFFHDQEHDVFFYSVALRA